MPHRYIKSVVSKGHIAGVTTEIGASAHQDGSCIVPAGAYARRARFSRSARSRSVPAYGSRVPMIRSNHGAVTHQLAS